MAPEEVVTKLNEYLPRMEECVDQAGGTIDKYIGDAVMAFWNAPDDQPDHALRAVSAAWAMLQALERLNKEWAVAGLPALRIGIGLNTGEVLVGNVGSERLKSYTVIGSAVNQASRLEGANKDLGTSILLGAETYRQVQDHVTVKEHSIHVKGVDEALLVYELIEFMAPKR
jgi:adenylate cyclase